ncbi:addiction module protein [Mycolicibacterium sp. XJ879]
MTVWERMQQALLRRGINTVFELMLWIALLYTVIGVAYAMLHIELIGQLKHALSAQFTVFANIAALVVTVAFWPALLASSLLCGVAGCGLLT